MGRKVVALLDSGAAVNAVTEELRAARGLHQSGAGLWLGPEGSGVPDRAAGAVQREQGGHRDRLRPRRAGDGRR
eukprot:6340559-Alexandrium_andersonii.AAC.1